MKDGFNSILPIVSYRNTPFPQLQFLQILLSVSNTLTCITGHPCVWYDQKAYIYGIFNVASKQLAGNFFSCAYLLCIKQWFLRFFRFVYRPAVKMIDSKNFIRWTKLDNN